MFHDKFKARDQVKENETSKPLLSVSSLSFFFENVSVQILLPACLLALFVGQQWLQQPIQDYQSIQYY
jgi:hypothetical protein